MSEPSGAVVRIEDLTKIYHRRLIALNGVNLEVQPGTVLGILGPNGAGKTTLIKLMLGLQIPTAGRVYVLGRPMSPNAAALRRRMGYLPADPKFPPCMTPIDYLDYVGRLSGLVHRVRRPRLAALLRAVDLLRYAGEPIPTLSTGMKTRLAIAASLLNDPDLLIWDEPAQGLDGQARRSMIALIRSLAESKTLILCTHNLGDVHEVCQRSVVMHEGQVIYDGNLEDLGAATKPHEVEITLTGERRELAESLKTIQGFEELEACKLHKNILNVRIKEGTSHATALANVLVTLADHHLEMTGMKVSGSQTDQAISDLTRQEGSRGFTRACAATVE